MSLQALAKLITFYSIDPLGLSQLISYQIVLHQYRTSGSFTAFSRLACYLYQALAFLAICSLQVSVLQVFQVSFLRRQSRGTFLSSLKTLSFVKCLTSTQCFILYVVQGLVISPTPPRLGKKSFITFFTMYQAQESSIQAH